MRQTEKYRNEHGLTRKQHAFCQEYMIDFNAAKAANRAGYSVHSSAAIAARLLLNVKIRDHLDKLMEERSQRTQITADRVLQELAAIGFSRITDVVEIGDGITNEEGDVVNRLKVKKTSEWTIESSKSVEMLKEDRYGALTVKMHTKVAALQKLGEHLGLFRDISQAKQTLSQYGVITETETGFVFEDGVAEDEDDDDVAIADGQSTSDDSGQSQPNPTK
ncbi:MAG: terminase small subunit [Cetobacterium sp.]